MVSINEIVKKIPDLVIVENADIEITNAQPVDRVTNGIHISFISGSGEKARRKSKNFSGACMIVSYEYLDEGVVMPSLFPPSVLVSKNPRLAFVRLVKEFFYNRKKKTIHPTASIGEGVKIGAGTTIHANVTIYDGVKIGKNCKIKAGAVLGATGFGYEKNEDGRWEDMPHIGGLTIMDNVHIGANACIDRGTMDDTIIGEGAKIDNNVHIAHNVIIGANTVIIANSMIAGSVYIGRDCWIAPMTSIRDGLKIGRNVSTGMGSVVVKDIPDNTRVMGVPAKPY